MKNTKILMLVLGMVALGAVGSIAIQSHAQTQKISASDTTSVSNQDQINQIGDVPDQKDVIGKDLETNDDGNMNADQKDAQGNDLETNDDSGINTGKESMNDIDSSIQSEQGEKDGNQGDGVEQGE